MTTTVLLALTLAGLLPGAQAPEFAARNQDGKVVKLSDFKGRPVLLYFYPKDDTPGCTAEARGLRDDFPRFQELGGVILGVSSQGEASHKAFRDKLGLPFDLLVDADGALARAYGVGRAPLLGLHARESVLIGADGKVIRHFDSVDPARHSAEVLAELRRATARPAR